MRPTVVVLGMVTKIPVSGVTWQTAHYLEGLRRLGCEVVYLEAHARTPSMFMRREGDDGSGRAAAFLARFAATLGLEDRWAFWALHEPDAPMYGMARERVDAVLHGADAVINLHGGTDPDLVPQAAGRLVYLETDPVQLQIELHDGVPETRRFLDAHEAFFTFGELWGRDGCRLPADDRYRFWPTRQPVVCDWWSGGAEPAPDASWTTVASWRQPWREVWLDGERYLWTKDEEFRRFSSVPAASARKIDLALSGCEPSDRAELRAAGWAVSDASRLSDDSRAYRAHVRRSFGEMTVAKDQNVRLRSGWFSDRSATYLAAGRPVVTQATGFEEVLPTGEGLHAFRTPEECIDALQAVEADPVRHRTAAAALARDHFAHDVVLRPLLDRLGLAPGRTPTSWGSIPLTPVRRRPLVLDPAVDRHVATGHLPAWLPATRPARPAATVVVVTWNHWPVTSLCLESLLLDPDSRDLEIVVVDNGSDDGTVAELEALGRRWPNLRVEPRPRNEGFAAAANRGVAVARSDVVVLLNNDTVVPPGWWRRLIAHLDDPMVGMVCPRTNAAPTAARLDLDYASVDEMAAADRRLAVDHAGASSELVTLTMFCAALRRSTIDAIGPLDEQFGIGMFEDDDYSARIRAAGLTVRCAHDVLVHHFGEASFGDLFASGDHGRIFRANQRRFEDKWSTRWSGHDRLPDEGYSAVRSGLRLLVEERTPAGATVLVVSRGDDELCRFEGRSGRHFPADADGAYVGHHPADDAEAIALLERTRVDGARFLAVPTTSRWWLDHYGGLRRHLESEYATLVDDPAVGVIFEAAS